MNTPSYNRIEAVDLAHQIERCGEAYYDQAVQEARNPKVKQLLAHLRDEEQAHSRSFEALLDGIEGADGDWRTEEEYRRWMRGFAKRRVFPDLDAAREFVRGLKTDADLIAQAIRFEQQTIEFLEHLRNLVHADETDVIDELVAEEREHERLLTARLERIQGADTGSWSPQ
jgi:rubrerythrin